jgi:hypothetical protein
MSIVLLDSIVCDNAYEFIKELNLTKLFEKIYDISPEQIGESDLEENEIVEKMIEEIENFDITPGYIKISYYIIGGNRYGVSLYGNYRQKNFNTLVRKWNFGKIREIITSKVKRL